VCGATHAAARVVTMWRKILLLMVFKLERDYKFEIKDLNWQNMRRFNNDCYNSCVGLHRAEEEDEALRMKVEALIKGLRRTLENIDITYQHVTCVQSTAFEYCDGGAAYVEHIKRSVNFA
jgi:hypothetical protein